MSTITPDDLTTQWDENTSFPFVEDENCNITGYGHQDKAAFAAEVDRYDAVCNDGPIEDHWAADDIGHAWAVAIDDERFTTRDITAETPGAFPVTTLWGQR